MSQALVPALRVSKPQIVIRTKIMHYHITCLTYSNTESGVTCMIYDSSYWFLILVMKVTLEAIVMSIADSGFRNYNIIKHHLITLIQNITSPDFFHLSYHPL